MLDYKDQRMKSFLVICILIIYALNGLYCKSGKSKPKISPRYPLNDSMLWLNDTYCEKVGNCSGYPTKPTEVPITTTLPTEDPETTKNPNTTKNPKTSESTGSTEITENPQISKDPKTSEDPKTTENPKTTKNPETTKKPESTKNPETTKNPKTTENSETTKNPESTKNPETTIDPETTENSESTKVTESIIPSLIPTLTTKETDYKYKLLEISVETGNYEMPDLPQHPHANVSMLICRTPLDCCWTYKLDNHNFKDFHKHHTAKFNDHRSS